MENKKEKKIEIDWEAVDAHGVKSYEKDYGRFIPIILIGTNE